MEPVARLSLVAAAAVVLLLAPSRPARAKGKLDVATVQELGGSYAVDCRKPGARVVVSADTLAVSVGTKEVASHDVLRALTFAGRTQPADYRGTLVGDTAGGEPLVFHAYRDARNTYLIVDADSKLQATFGKATFVAKFRRCEAPQDAPPAPAAAKPETAKPETAKPETKKPESAKAAQPKLAPAIPAPAHPSR